MALRSVMAEAQPVVNQKESDFVQRQMHELMGVSVVNSTICLYPQFFRRREQSNNVCS